MSARDEFYMAEGFEEMCYEAMADEIDRLRHHVEQHLKRIHQLERAEA